MEARRHGPAPARCARVGGRLIADLRVGVPFLAAAGRLMRETTGLALLATAAPLTAQRETDSMGSLVDRLVAAHRGDSVGSVPPRSVHGLALTPGRSGRRLALVTPMPGAQTSAGRS